MNIAVAIETNRLALLRIVSCWLVIASTVARYENALLPPRISRWIVQLIFKAEKAAASLTEAACYTCAKRNGYQLTANDRSSLQSFAYRKLFSNGHNPQTIGQIRRRLNMLHDALCNLSKRAARYVKRCASMAKIIGRFIRIGEVTCENCAQRNVCHTRIKPVYNLAQIIAPP